VTVTDDLDLTAELDAAEAIAMGRTSKRSGSKNRQRQKQVAVRLSDEEHAHVLAAAKRQDVSAASVLRYTFLATYTADPPADPIVTEHAHQMSGGGYHVWNTEPYIEEIYPLEQRIKAGQRHGGKVYRRQVIVVEDWTEIPSPLTGEAREDEEP